MSEIVLDHVSKRYGDGTVAVRDVNLTVADGEFFILVGPSGCGKSTLLNMIAGLEDVSEGEIRVDGRMVNDVDPKDRNMAMVFQSYAVYPHMTVAENLAFPLRLAGRSSEEIERRVRSAAQMLGLQEHLGRQPGQLSGGQRQRVAIGRAIVREPCAFLMDEPLSNLDAKLRVQMRTEIARLQKGLGATMVYVTHDQTEAMTLGDRVAVLRDGVVQQIGSPRELYEQPANLFVAGFIGSPPMNFLPMVVEGGRVRLPMVEFAVPEEWAGWLEEEQRPLVAGIRPEAFAVVSSSGDVDGRAAVFRATVDVIEWVGAEMLIYFDIGMGVPDGIRQVLRGQGLGLSGADRVQVVARLQPQSEVVEGTEIVLEVGLTLLHVFDPVTGKRLPRSY